MDPLILTGLVAGGIFAVSFVLGRNSKDTVTFDQATSIIDATIENLCRDGYIHYYYDEDGEMEILTIAEYNIRLAKEEKANGNS